jgi:hypothetical protein
MVLFFVCEHYKLPYWPGWCLAASLYMTVLAMRIARSSLALCNSDTRRVAEVYSFHEIRFQRLSSSAYVTLGTLLNRDEQTGNLIVPVGEYEG